MGVNKILFGCIFLLRDENKTNKQTVDVDLIWFQCDSMANIYAKQTKQIKIANCKMVKRVKERSEREATVN